MKSYLAATALVLTLTGSALAQQTPPAAAGAVIQEQQQGQMLAETIIGTTVYNNSNENVGEVNDLLIGQDGRVVGVVVGVGGFLGIGERDVALQWSQVKMEMGASASSATGATSATGTATSSGTATSGTTAGGAATSTTTATPNAGTGPMTTPGTVANDAATRTAAVATGNDMRFVINISREDLRNMPEFRTLDDRARATPAAPATGTAPRPAQ